jgi:lipopolysaccharide/colanic/teichoic acid biosynthesis glycosyltransferase
MDGSQGSLFSEAVGEAVGIVGEPAYAGAYAPPSLHERHGRAKVSQAGKVGGVSKRAFDIVASGGALLALSPILLGIWLAVRLESSGPGLFRQRRGGYQGRPFHILKFRTMKTCEDKTIAQAKRSDDRTTRLGKFLRRNSIDELPQLLNVFFGDMSLIGPRPHALAHDRQFCTLDRRYLGRHHARPGITGLAQVSGSRGLTDTPEKIRQRTEYDLGYVANWSWAMDIRILLKTVLVVIRDRDVF